MTGRDAVIADILRLVPPRGAEASHVRANLDRLDDATLQAMRDGLAKAALEFGSELRWAGGTPGPGGGAGRARLTGGFTKLTAAAGVLQERSDMPPLPVTGELVRVDIERGKAGMYYATSPDMRGLFVAQTSPDAVRAVVTIAIREMHKTEARAVISVQVRETDGGQPCWFVMDSTDARACLEGMD